MSILDCKQIAYETVDVADPHRREEKLWMQSQLNLSDSDLTALPPQIFNGDTHRGVRSFPVWLSVEMKQFQQRGMQSVILAPG